MLGSIGRRREGTPWGWGDVAVKRSPLIVCFLIMALLVLAMMCSSAGAFVSTGDGSWVLQQSLPSGCDFRGAFFTDAQHGWAVDTTGWISTTSDGVNWSQNSNIGPAYAYAVSFPDVLHGWIVSTNGIAASGDGGATWTSQDSSAASGYLDWVAFPDAAHGWVVGFNGTILATVDGGAHWDAQRSGTPQTLFGGSFPDATHGWVVGDNGTILATSDGGTHWTPQNPGTAVELARVFFTDDSNGWIVGDLGTILATSDGGAHWSPQSSGTIQPLDGVTFSDALHGWAVGKGGTILATTDGGAHWNPQDSGTTEWLHAICVPDAVHGWAFGENGSVFATRTGGIAPPLTVASGVLNRAWYNHPLSVALTASPKANPVASVTYGLDGAPSSTVSGASTKAPIPVNVSTHANDGEHVLSYTATDSFGLAQFDSTLAVNIDTRRPTTSAPCAAKARRGKTATLKYRVADASPNGGTATVRLSIRNSSGKVVKTVKLGRKSLGKMLAATFTVPRTWRAGTYRFFVYATDQAGNAQATVAHNRLTVK